MKERREYSRTITKLKVCFELVGWQELDLDRLEYPIEMTAYDLSASGVRVEGNVEIGQNDLKRLMRGMKKIRLALYLPGMDSPLMSFARLIWSDNPALAEGGGPVPADAHQTGAEVQYGFRFIDVRAPFFDTIQSFTNTPLP
jgi:hypothetical protein